MKTLLRIGTLALLGLNLQQASAGTGADSYNLVEKGRYLAVVGDCTACHTLPGGAPFAGGVAIETPFGKLLGANITPDPETGLGRWSFEDFQAVMSTGHSRGGKRLYGAMPFTAYTKVRREDNLALWAYLQTLQPVHNPVETNQLPFPFSVRTSLIGWNWLNFTQGEFVPSAEKSAQWNRGAYLVEGLGHCGTCHTPKNLIGGDDNKRFLAGANLQGWVAPDITANPHGGIGQWSTEDLVQYLKTGANRFDIASGPMAEAVENSTQHWSDEDLMAVAVYLKDGPTAGKAPPPLAADTAAMVSGKAIYADRCSACHVGNGEGVRNLFPKLAAAPLVNNDDPTSLIHVVLAGSRAGGTDAAPTAPAMPSFAWNLSDDNIADVLTYVRNTWGNAAPAVSASDVAHLREDLAN
ncbi:cytochrome c [Pseudomonas sp. GD04087]|uniref:c-type cytochrome n=1 Tax=unclassified Pseudomonas TaxID=196821 RepID=UPI002447EBE5|nr:MULTISPECIES: cytochrome c [unclassified Pseudomonas]MDH0293501.1 cytochrome c [Pseudomonas sp. GD04087]MDH1052270.1 cytochrome c [Pseudomonas sp. GD03903]MDH1999033.1 cytochrome c [Pseudomonas sp. GD03691]